MLLEPYRLTQSTAPLEDVSDSESTGDSIPFNNAAESKDRDVAMAENDEDGDEEEEEEEEEEDM